MAYRIQIQTTNAAIGIESQNASMRVVKSAQMKVKLQQDPPSMKIERKLPKLSIDQTQCFNESGLKTPLLLAKDFYAESVQKGLNNIARTVNDSKKFLHIEDGGNPSKEIAVELNTPDYKGMTMVAMPKSRPKVRFEPSSIDIKWVTPEVQAQWQRQNAEVEYVPYKVKVFLRTRPSVEISVIDDSLPGAVGSDMDTTM